MTYPINDDAVKTLDELLKCLFDSERGAYPLYSFFEEMKVQKSSHWDIYNYCFEIMAERGLVDYRDFTVILKPQGEHFYNNGGFKADKERAEKEEIEKREIRQQLKKLNELSIEDIEKRFASLEENTKNQADFHKSQTKRNKWQLVYFVVMGIISISALIVSILSYFTQ